MYTRSIYLVFFFFNDTATTEIYTLSLHDALPISVGDVGRHRDEAQVRRDQRVRPPGARAACEVVIALSQPVGPHPRERRSVEVAREICGAVTRVDRRDVGAERVERRILCRQAGGGNEQGHQGEATHRLLSARGGRAYRSPGQPGRPPTSR